MMILIICYITYSSANRGFSIGINDVQPGEVLKAKKDELIESANKTCDDLIERSKSGKLVNQPGCNEEQTLEVNISYFAFTLS